MSKKNIVKILIIANIIWGIAVADNGYSSPVINEVAVKTSDESGTQWIELYNPTDTHIRIEGWILKDNNDSHEYVFPGSGIGSKQYLVIKNDESGFNFTLESEDAVRLFDASSNLVDETSWSDGDAPENKSWGRIPDGTGKFKTIDFPIQYMENKDNLPTLADAVLALKIVAGMTVSASAYTDINNDGRTGLEEAVYIIRDLSGIFRVRKPKARTFACCNGYEDTYWDTDYVCRFHYGTIDAEIYVQATPVSCTFCYEQWGTPVYDTEAWISINAKVSKLHAVYDFGHHGNDFIIFKFEGKQFMLDRSSSYSMGWGCSPPDCMKVGDEDGCKRETCSDRPSLPVTCVRVEADGSVPELLDPWEQHEGYDNYPILPCDGDRLCGNKEIVKK
ncbi:MAG: lamin tail domain-containing protein [Desulfobacterales bacterium]|nr:lamin tail domain-containing protein [Desulfobacterales bacterium]